MTFRPISIPILGLLLLSCERPGSRNVTDGPDSPESRTAPGGHKSRDRSREQPESLRDSWESAQRIESPEARNKALAEVAWNAVDLDPDLAQKAFDRLPRNYPERIRLIRHFAMRRTESDPDGASAWARSLDSETESAAAFSQVALVLAETDPLRAADLLSESGIEGRDFDVALVQVIQRWAAQSPPDAAAWVAAFPPGQAREASLKVIAGQWLPRDASAAFDWFQTLQDSDLRKETARALEGVILQQQAETRDAWLQHADAKILAELEQQRESAIEDVGDNIPPDRL